MDVSVNVLHFISLKILKRQKNLRVKHAGCRLIKVMKEFWRFTQLNLGDSQKMVTYSLSPSVLDCLQNGLHVEVTLTGCSGTHTNRFICQPSVKLEQSNKKINRNLYISGLSLYKDLRKQFNQTNRDLIE